MVISRIFLEFSRSCCTVCDIDKLLSQSRKDNTGIKNVRIIRHNISYFRMATQILFNDLDHCDYYLTTHCD